MKEQIAKYLANEMEEAERKQFEQQLLLDSKLSEELQACIASWEVSGVYKNSNTLFNSTEAWEKVSNQIRIERSIKPSTSKSNFSFLKIAATTVLIAAVGYIGFKATDELTFDDSTELSSSLDVEKHALPDGSTLILNTNSTVTYEKGFGLDHRNIQLTGAANFDVIRNEDLPFIITTENSKVQVLGTSFEVSAYNNEPVEVNVSSGRVGFSSTKAKGEPAILEAGDKAILSSDGTAMQKAIVKNDNYAAWWTRELVFDNTKLSEVAKDLEKAYWVRIDVSNAIKDCPVTQNLKDQSLEGVLDILKVTFPSSFEIKNIKENHLKLDGVGCTN